MPPSFNITFLAGLFSLVLVAALLLRGSPILPPAPVPASADEASPPPGGLEVRYRELLDPLFRQRRFSFYPHGFEMFVGTGNQACVALRRGEMLGGNMSYY